MQLYARVESAKIGMFNDSIELSVTDKGTKKASGTGRSQYTCNVIRGWQGLGELREMKKQGADEQTLANFAAQIPLPQEDDLLNLNVMETRVKNNFQTFVCEVMV